MHSERLSPRIYSVCFCIDVIIYLDIYLSIYLSMYVNMHRIDSCIILPGNSVQANEEIESHTELRVNARVIKERI